MVIPLVGSRHGRISTVVASSARRFQRRSVPVLLPWGVRRVRVGDPGDVVQAGGVSRGSLLEYAGEGEGETAATQGGGTRTDGEPCRVRPSLHRELGRRVPCVCVRVCLGGSLVLSRALRPFLLKRSREILKIFEVAAVVVLYQHIAYDAWATKWG